MSESVVYNGKVIPKEDFQLNLNDRGFQYADGFFETLLFANNTFPYLETHYQRVKSACESTCMANGFPSLEEITQWCTELQQTLASANKLVIKWIVSRKDGGLYAPDSTSTNHLLLIRAVQSDSVKHLKKVGFFSDFPKPYSSLSQYKSLACQQYVMAGLYQKQHELEDLVLLDANGFVSEGLYSNIFWINNDQLFTPPVDTACVNGIIRQEILKSYDVLEKKTSPKDLLEANHVFLTNSLSISLIEGIQDKNFVSTHPIIESIKATFYSS